MEKINMREIYRLISWICVIMLIFCCLSACRAFDFSHIIKEYGDDYEENNTDLMRNSYVPTEYYGVVQSEQDIIDALRRDNFFVEMPQLDIRKVDCYSNGLIVVADREGLEYDKYGKYTWCDGNYIYEDGSSYGGTPVDSFDKTTYYKLNNGEIMKVITKGCEKEWEDGFRIWGYTAKETDLYGNELIYKNGEGYFYNHGNLFASDEDYYDSLAYNDYNNTFDISANPWLVNWSYLGSGYNNAVYEQGNRGVYINKQGEFMTDNGEKLKYAPYVGFVYEDTEELFFSREEMIDSVEEN